MKRSTTTTTNNNNNNNKKELKLVHICINNNNNKKTVTTRRNISYTYLCYTLLYILFLFYCCALNISVVCWVGLNTYR